MSQALSTGRLTPYALTGLRVMAGLLFLAHGLVKLAGFPDGAQPGIQPLASLLGVGAVIEVVTGVLLALGLFMRPAAFIASGMMAVAYFLFHAPANVHPILNGGEPAILFSFVFLLFSAAGPGAFALDNLVPTRAPRRAIL